MGVFEGIGAREFEGAVEGAEAARGFQISNFRFERGAMVRGGLRAGWTGNR